MYSRCRSTSHRLAYSYVSIPVSCDPYCTCMCYGDPPRLLFVVLTFSCLRFLLVSSCDDSSLARTSLCPTPICYPDDSSLSRSRFFLHPVFSPTFYSYPTGRYSCLVLLRFLRLFVLVFPRLVYILGWRWDDPHLQSTLQPP